MSRPASKTDVAGAERYRINNLLVDVDTRRILIGDVEIHLTELSFDVLVCLIRRAPAVVSKQRLMREAWHGAVVEPETIKKRVALLRESLANVTCDLSLIRVVRGRGYAIDIPVERLAQKRPDAARNWRAGTIAASLLVLTVTIIVTGIITARNDRPGLSWNDEVNADPAGSNLHVSDGESVFNNLCAACHGVSGKGDGPAAGSLKKNVPDLTVLSASNHGVFPWAHVEKAIAGKYRVVAHETIDMPVWGGQFQYVRDRSFPLHDAFARERIKILTAHIEKLQI
jgi:DNA-binding winged helix-turn-helix (wHTH) protein